MEKRGVRHGRGAYRALALVLTAAALTACGSGDAGVTTAAGPARLVVREYDGQRLTSTIRLDCASRGGPCDRVVALLPRLAPRPDEVCTQIYGGPERRVVSGTVDGRAVNVEVTRTDGCQIARYDLLTEALRA